MDKEYLKQSLSDAGCCNEASDTILERFESALMNKDYEK